MPNAVIAHAPDGNFDIDALRAKAAGLAGPRRHGPRAERRVDAALRMDADRAGRSAKAMAVAAAPADFKVVAIDYGVKRNILRLLADAGCSVTVAPSTATAEEILALRPDGVFLSNGPGDPAETGKYAVPVIRALLDEKDPDLRHLSRPSDAGAGGRRQDDQNEQGHHGANHPVKDFTTGKVEIVSMNHGFAVDRVEPAGQRARRRIARCSTARTAASH